MGWSEAYQYLHAAAAKRGAADIARVDTGLPLNARIGSVLSLQQTPLIRAIGDGALIAMPEAGDTRIVAIGQLGLNLAGSLYRYYLTTGDGDSPQTFLQIYQDAHGEIGEILYCTRLARVIPETAADQDAYTGTGGAGLGDRSYTLWRAQLADMGYDAATLDLAFGHADGLDYWRDAGEPDTAFVAPYTGGETRIDDASGQHGRRQQIYFMPYARALRGGGSERLLITTEIVTSVNGDASQRGIHVDFVVGIPLEQERIVIQ